MRPLVIGGFVLLAFLYGACGSSSDTGPSLEEYFSALQQIVDEADDEGAAYEEELDERLLTASGQDVADAYGDFFEQSAPLARSMLDELRAVDVPGEAQPEHDAFAEAFEGLVEAFEMLEQDVRQATTQEEAEQLFSGAIFEVLLAAEALCLELEMKASDAGIDADLLCDE